MQSKVTKKTAQSHVLISCDRTMDHICQMVCKVTDHIFVLLRHQQIMLLLERSQLLIEVCLQASLDFCLRALQLVCQSSVYHPQLSIALLQLLDQNMAMLASSLYPGGLRACDVQLLRCRQTP